MEVFVPGDAFLGKENAGFVAEDRDDENDEGAEKDDSGKSTFDARGVLSCGEGDVKGDRAKDEGAQGEDELVGGGDGNENSFVKMVAGFEAGEAKFFFLAEAKDGPEGAETGEGEEGCSGNAGVEGVAVWIGRGEQGGDADKSEEKDAGDIAFGKADAGAAIRVGNLGSVVDGCMHL